MSTLANNDKNINEDARNEIASSQSYYRMYYYYIYIIISIIIIVMWNDYTL